MSDRLAMVLDILELKARTHAGYKFAIVRVTTLVTLGSIKSNVMCARSTF